MRNTAAILIIFASFGCAQNHGASSSTGASTASTTAASTTQAAPTVVPATPLAPTIAALSTNSGPVDGGVPVTITGAHFQAPNAGETLVLFGLRGVAVTPVSDTRIDVIAPTAPNAGVVSVRVVNALGAGELANAFTFTPRSSALAFSPDVGHSELGFAGTKITLTLKDFAPLTSSTSVSFGATPAASVALVDSTTLVAEVPDGLTAGASVSISVEESGRKVAAPGFLVQPPLAYGDLTINEFAAHPGGLDANGDGLGNSSADEFIEIVNTTTHAIDLSYLIVFDSKSTERHRFPNPTTLPAGGALVVFGAGTPMGFAPAHRSGAAQCATSGALGLDNAGDTIELRTLPGLAARGTTIFMVSYTNPPGGASFQNPNDGQKITHNPATSADYMPHKQAPSSNGNIISPGRRVDGSKF